MLTICLTALSGKLADGGWDYTFNLNYTLQPPVIEFYLAFPPPQAGSKNFFKKSTKPL